MKIRLNNVNNDEKSANIMANVILMDIIDQLEGNGQHVEDVRLEEVELTFSAKIEGSTDYAIVSVQHEDVTEMLTVDYDMEDGTREDNEQMSLFSEGDRAFADVGIDADYEEIEPTFKDTELEKTKEDVYGDMLVKRYKHRGNGKTVVRVYQLKEDEPEFKLIQEVSYR